MAQPNDLFLFTTRYERGEMSTEAYRKALTDLAKNANENTRAHIKRRLEALER